MIDPTQTKIRFGQVIVWELGDLRAALSCLMAPRAMESADAGPIRAGDYPGAIATPDSTGGPANG